MSYNTIWQSVSDQALSGRITACIAQEIPAGIDPYGYLPDVRWQVITSSDVEAAYASALAGGNANPGGDESVITDGMILAHTQAAIAVLPVPPDTTGPPPT